MLSTFSLEQKTITAAFANSFGGQQNLPVLHQSVDYIFWYRMWDLIVSVPDHYLSFYFVINERILGCFEYTIHPASGSSRGRVQFCIYNYYCSWFNKMSLVTRKTCLRGLRPSKTQIGLCSHRSKIEAWNLVHNRYFWFYIIVTKERTTKVLIRLRGCAGWSAPLLSA